MQTSFTTPVRATVSYQAQSDADKLNNVSVGDGKQSSEKSVSDGDGGRDNDAKIAVPIHDNTASMRLNMCGWGRGGCVSCAFFIIFLTYYVCMISNEVIN